MSLPVIEQVADALGQRWRSAGQSVTQGEIADAAPSRLGRARTSGVRSYILRRVAAVIPIILLVTLVAFLLVELVPGDPATKVAGEFATPEQVESVRQDMGLNDPLVVRYGEFLGRLVRGDLGTSVSFQPGRPVQDIIGELAPITLSLALVTMAFTVLIGLPLGAAAALRPRSLVDRAVTLFMTAALAVPPFVLGPVLIAVLAINNPIFPALGYVPFKENPGDWLRHLVLPAATLALNPAAELARQVRASLVGELDESYIRTAYGKGLTMQRVVGKHAAKNAGIAAVTVLGLQVGRIVGGSVVVESVFNLPGLGSLAYRSVVRPDYPVIQALVVLMALFVLMTNLVVDLSYLYFDPKLRDQRRL